MTLDIEETFTLAAALVQVAHAFQKQRIAKIGPSAQIEFEILNAFGCAVAPFIAAAPPNRQEELVGFFDKARDDTIADLIARQRLGHDV